MELITEAKELSAHIATLKRKRNVAKDIAEIERLTEEIKIRQYQALFYIEKMENVNKSIKESNEQR